MSETSVEPTPFGIAEHMDNRERTLPFVMAEIGHGEYPAIDNSDGFFTGSRLYIGIEAGLRASDQAESSAVLRDRYLAQNAFFLVHNLGEGGIHRPDVRSNEEDYKGEYDPGTLLPDSSVDEVFISNVFCDPALSKSFVRTLDLLKEIRRILAPDGTAVVRETITPWKAELFYKHTLGISGLKEVQRVMPADEDSWLQLESLYGTEQDSELWDSSYYSLLRKEPAK